MSGTSGQRFVTARAGAQSTLAREQSERQTHMPIKKYTPRLLFQNIIALDSYIPSCWLFKKIRSL